MSTYIRYPAAGGSGTVTSVGLSAPAIFTVTGSPVTGSGTLALTLANETANFVWAGPTTGAAAAPTFRALVAADIPALPYAPTALTSAHIFVGNASNVATDVAVGGDLTALNTGAFTVATVGGSTASAVNTATVLANNATDLNTASQIVRRDGSGNFTAGTITATLSGTATNISGIAAANHGGTGVANNVASTLTISGAFALTLTISNTTSVTLPVSGTLATLAGSEIFTNKTISGASNTLSNIADGSLSTSYLKADGTRPLSGNWDAGAFSGTFNSVVVGSAANAISAVNTLVSATSLTLKTNTSTTAMLLAANGDVTNTNTNGFVVNQTATGTSFTNASTPLQVANSSATTNNWAAISFTDSATAGASSSGYIAAQFSDRTNHYSSIAIGVRSALGFLNQFQVNSNGVTLGNSGTSANTVNGTLSAASSGTFNSVAVGSAANTISAVSTLINGSATSTLSSVSTGTGTLMPGSNWTSYTPTFAGVGTVSNVSVFWRRVGDSVQVRGSCTLGTTAATIVSISLPSGANTIDTSKVPGDQTALLGSIYRAAGGGAIPSTSFGVWAITAITGTSTSLVYPSITVNSATPGFQTVLGSTLGNSTDRIMFEFSVPVTQYAF